MCLFPGLEICSLVTRIGSFGLISQLSTRALLPHWHAFFFLAFLMAGLLQKMRSEGKTPHRVGREGIFRPYLLAAKHLAKLKDFSGLANYFKPV